MATTLRIVATHRLSPAVLDECHAHFAAYMSITREAYADSLSHKTWIAIHRDQPGGRVVGQVTARLARETHPIDGRPLAILSCHHAAVDPAFRRARLVERSILRFCLLARARRPFGRMLFLFDAMGYGSYLHLAHGLPDCWPRHDAPMPAPYRELLHALMTREHGDAWLPDRGVLRWPERRLHADAAPITEAMMRADVHIRFFAEANPGHARGESLVCLAPVSWRNFSHAVRHRLLRPARHTRDDRPNAG